MPEFKFKDDGEIFRAATYNMNQAIITDVRKHLLDKFNSFDW